MPLLRPANCGGSLFNQLGQTSIHMHILLSMKFSLPEIVRLFLSSTSTVHSCSIRERKQLKNNDYVNGYLLICSFDRQGEKQKEILQKANYYISSIIQNKNYNYKEMKSSSFSQKHSPQYDPDSDTEVPKQWDYLSKRLAEVEKGLTLLEKKYTKIDKKITAYTHQTNDYQAELTQQILKLKSDILSKSQQTDDLVKTIQILEKQIKNSTIDILNNRIDTLTLSLHDRNDSIEMKVRGIYDQVKAYVDRVVFQMKQSLKKSNRDQDLEKRLEKGSRENSPSFLPKNLLNKSRSSKKFHENVLKSESSERNQQTVNNWSQKNGSFSKQSNDNNNLNRVSYLREKLKQFEKVNKKYESQPELTTGKSEKEQIVKKMRNYRQYLEQSQSQLEPSNILTSQQMTGLSSTKKNNFSIF